MAASADGKFVLGLLASGSEPGIYQMEISAKAHPALAWS
jgi:hypothetical protein